MNSLRRSSFIVGVFFILAAITAIIGVILYDPILNNPDYLTEAPKYGNQIVFGAIMELILVISAVVTSTTMFPILRRYNETIALWHICFRFLEAIVITIGVISVLSLLTLSREFILAGSTNIESFKITGAALKAIHDWTFMLGPNFMLGLNTIMYSYIFYRSKLVPRFIPILGIIGSILVFLAAILEMFGVINQLSTWGGLLAFPVALNEMILAVWLIVKGFNRSAFLSLPINKKINN